MLGLQGKSTKPTAREPFSKSGNVGVKSRPVSGMVTTVVAASRVRSASSSGMRNSNKLSNNSSTEKPEKLSRVTNSSPYNSKMSTTGASTTNRRVQSAAATIRHNRNALGPTVKASELFRKNSEPQLANDVNQRGPTQSGGGGSLKLGETSKMKLNKSMKHVRIEGTSKNLSSMPNANAIRFDYPHDGSGDAPMQHKRPFSFSSDRSRSVSVTSNDSYSTNEHESTVTSAGESPRPGWRQDLANNNGANNNNEGTFPTTARFHPPRLQKRSYSMDAYAMDSGSENDLPPSRQEDFHAQMIQMKIAEHPDEMLKEENSFNSGQSSLNSVKSSIQKNRFKPDLNKTFTEESPRKSSDFDRLLLMHSDNILQDVSELINDIKSSESIPQKVELSYPSSRASSVEKLVDELRKDINQRKTSTSADVDETRKEMHEKMTASILAERFNFNNMDISGIELSDITCPQQVMEQSVPNSSRLDRPLSATAEVFLGTTNNLFSSNSEQNANFLMSTKIEKDRSDTRSQESSDSNNHPFSSASDALSTIQQLRGGSSARGGDASSTSPQSAFGIDQEEIQRKICCALKLLEEEDVKVRNRNRSGDMMLSPSVRSQSPFLSTSNPDSRAESRGCIIESCKSSPRYKGESRNISHESPQFKMQVRTPPQKDERNHHACGRDESDFAAGFRSARSCSCLMEKKSTESLNSARSFKSTSGSRNSDTSKTKSKIPRPGSGQEEIWETKDNKTKQIFSFLDEVEKTDQEMLFGLRFETDELGRVKSTNPLSSVGIAGKGTISANDHSSATDKKSPTEKQFRTMDGLIRKGSVELAREILLLERKLDEAQHGVKLLEESLINQRELNIRNLRNSERDFKKRMKMQKDEFDLAFSRNEALINEMASEKRALQEKLDKLLKNFEDMEEKHKEQMKSIQQKHLEEIRRLRKMQQNAENSLKQKIAGNKAQAHEIKEMTVKGLEPEVQRIIQRHQQEMSEMRAWHADEVREIEERYQRKLHMQLDDIREKFAKEKEDLIEREREMANRRLDSELKQKDEEIENLKRKHANDLFEERERIVSEEMRLKDQLQETVRKAQIKGEVELENLKQEYEIKIQTLERRHESELKSVKDVFEAERQNWASNQLKKLEQTLSEQESKLREAFQQDKEKEWREKERKLREDFEKHRKDDELASDSRFKRMQEKFQTELEEMEKSEKDVKSKFSQAKSDLLSREEEVYSLKTTLSMKEKQLIDLQEMNMKMQEERINLTSVIRREFTDQIQSIEEECRALKTNIVELQSNSKLQMEQKQLEIERIIAEKDAEIEKIGLRVKQALGRKDETILELQKQLEKCSFQINHLEELLEEQRKEFLHSMKVSGNSGTGPKKK